MARLFQQAVYTHRFIVVTQRDGGPQYETFFAPRALSAIVRPRAAVESNLMTGCHGRSAEYQISKAIAPQGGY
jgi:hypothetical protein